MIINLNWTKNISFGSSIWTGSSTKLMLTTETPGKSTHYNQVFAMQRFLISLRKEAMKKKKTDFVVHALQYHFLKKSLT